MLSYTGLSAVYKNEMTTALSYKASVKMMSRVIFYIDTSQLNCISYCVLVTT